MIRLSDMLSAVVAAAFCIVGLTSLQMFIVVKECPRCSLTTLRYSPDSSRWRGVRVFQSRPFKAAIPSARRRGG
ncbi:MAG TPA: hypothetical protein DEW39_00660 [Brevibacterium sp.]|nr:hypothetical protein [Brevibacterium sp.]